MAPSEMTTERSFDRNEMRKLEERWRSDPARGRAERFAKKPDQTERPIETPRAPVPDAELEERIQRIERFADLMDTRFKLPLIGWRVGLDGLIGLVPGIGDTVATGISGWLIAEGWRLGARRRTIARMLGNLGIDWAVGLVPLVGDILDFGYKANARNARILAADLREVAMRRRAAEGADHHRRSTTTRNATV